VAEQRPERVLLVPAAEAGVIAQRTPRQRKAAAVALDAHSLAQDTLRDFDRRHFPSPREPKVVPPPDLVLKGQKTPAGRKSQRSSESTTSGRGLASTAAKGPYIPPAWALALRQPDIPVRLTEKVVGYLEFYRSNRRGRAILRHWLKRQGRYKEMISGLLKKHGVPQTLLYLVMIESGYNPSCTSRVGAAGLWQFMPMTGQSYDLDRNHWIDERRNPVRSTLAGIRYLKSLYEKTGSWELSFASFHAGLGAILTSAKKYNTNDYYQLCDYESGLPWETTLYVPKILAAALVAENRKFFGFDEVEPDRARRFELVRTQHSLSLKQVAKLADVDLASVRELNPELRRGRTPPKQTTWIRLPRGSGQTFYVGLSNVRGQLDRIKLHSVRLGDTVENVAADFAVSAAILRQMNSLDRSELLIPGIEILVPKKERKPSPAEDDKTGEGDVILVGVPPETPTSIQGRKRIFYRAVRGDDIDRVAEYLGLGRSELLRWNRLDPKAKLMANMVLVAFVKKPVDQRRVRLLPSTRVLALNAGSERFLNLWEERNGRRRLTYTTRRGDTIRRISKRFGLSVGSISRINKINRNKQISQGETVVLYVDKRRLQRQRNRVAKKASSKARRVTIRAGKAKRKLVAASIRRKKKR
jgi:membrane-bound lytic murein transglycosylase D